MSLTQSNGSTGLSTPGDIISSSPPCDPAILGDYMPTEMAFGYPTPPCDSAIPSAYTQPEAIFGYPTPPADLDHRDRELWG